MKQYTVWICVEEFDSKKFTYKDIALSFGQEATFSGRYAMERAINYATDLHNLVNTHLQQDEAE